MVLKGNIFSRLGLDFQVFFLDGLLCLEAKLSLSCIQVRMHSSTDCREAKDILKVGYATYDHVERPRCLFCVLNFSKLLSIQTNYNVLKGELRRDSLLLKSGHQILIMKNQVKDKFFIIWARRAHNKTVVASQGAPTSSRFMEEKL